MITIVSRASRSPIDLAAAARREQALGGFAHDDEVDVARARIGERQRDAGNRARRPHAGVELELDAQVELRRDLGAVGVADRRPAHRAEQDRVGRARRVERRLRAALRRCACSAARRPDAMRSGSANGCRARASRAAGCVASITSGPMPSPGSTQISNSRFNRASSFAPAGDPDLASNQDALEHSSRTGDFRRKLLHAGIVLMDVVEYDITVLRHVR